MRRRLVLVAGQGYTGGGEVMLVNLGTAARQLGWEVVVVGPKWGDLDHRCCVAGLRLEKVGGRNRRTYAAGLSTRLARRGLGIVWGNGALPALAATATPNPLIVHLHQRLGRLQALALRPAITRASRVVVPSQAMGREVPDSTVLLNWTEDVPPIEPKIRRPGLTIGYLGRIGVDKGVDTLAEALSLLASDSDVETPRLLIAGDSRFVPGSSSEAVLSALKACGAEVTFLGWTERERLLGSVDLLVVPSRVESFGLVAAEAMAARCPLIVSDVPALREVVGPDYPWVFSLGEAKSLAWRLRAFEGSELGTLKDRQRARWERLFSPKAGMARLGDLLESIVDDMPVEL